MEKIIIVNSGSISKKYALYEGANLSLFAHFEVLPKGFQLHLRLNENITKSQQIEQTDFDRAFDYFIDLLIERKIIEKETDINAVSFRLVAPGKIFQKDSIVDDEYLQKIEDVAENSLIHIQFMRNEMKQVINRLHTVPTFAISDSSFHSTIPNYANRYAISNEITEKYEIYRFGYHGISVSSVIENLKNAGTLPSKVIVCHLGGGSSVTAIVDGKSIENSMGYTPIEGLPMSTRSGNIDAGAVLAIMEYSRFDTDQMKDLLFNKSGVRAISEVSEDTRDIIEEADKGNEKAHLALDMYVYGLKKMIGAYFSIMGGVDLLVFTGTIGERSYRVREKVCDCLQHLGIYLDVDLNKKTVEGDGYINVPNTDVSILVKRTDEMAEMARKTVELLKNNN